MAAVAEIGGASAWPRLGANLPRKQVPPPYYCKSKTALDETEAALPASNLSAHLNGIYSLDHPHDGRYAVSYETVSNDEAKLAVLGACDARTVFGDKSTKSREVEGFGRQELID